MLKTTSAFLLLERHRDGLRGREILVDIVRMYKMIFYG